MQDRQMTDQQIVEGLISRDDWVAKHFFFVKCRPLLYSILTAVFDKKLQYEEMVNELYIYLIDNDCRKLRQFDFKSSIYQWLKVVALRFFIQKRASLIENVSKAHLYERLGDDEVTDTIESISDCLDVMKLLELMNNQRYATAIRHLILEDMEPARCAAIMDVKVDNLYNIKKRAMAEITRVAFKYYKYGK